MQLWQVWPRDALIQGGLHVLVAAVTTRTGTRTAVATTPGGEAGFTTAECRSERLWTNQPVGSRSGPYDVQLCQIWPRNALIQGGLHVLVAAVTIRTGTRTAVATTPGGEAGLNHGRVPVRTAARHSREPVERRSPTHPN